MVFSNLAHHHPPWQEEGEEPPAFFSSSSFLDSNQGKGWLKSGWTSNETGTKEQKRCANPCNNQSRVESLSSSNLKKKFTQIAVGAKTKTKTKNHFSSLVTFLSLLSLEEQGCKALNISRYFRRERQILGKLMMCRPAAHPFLSYCSFV